MPGTSHRGTTCPCSAPTAPRGAVGWDCDMAQPRVQPRVVPRAGPWAGWALGEPGVAAARAPYLEGVRAQNPHGCPRRVGTAVPAALGAVCAGDMAPGEGPSPAEGSQPRPAAPSPAQRRLRGSTAGLSRIGPRWAPAGRAQRGEPGTPRGSAGSRGTRPAAAVSVRAQPQPPLPIISDSFLIYLNKQAALTSAEVFEQPGPG